MNLELQQVGDLAGVWVAVKVAQLVLNLVEQSVESLAGLNVAISDNSIFII